MPDLDLGPAIEAAAKAFWESGTHPVPWDQLEPASREPYLIDMRAAIEGALPELRKAIAEKQRPQGDAPFWIHVGDTVWPNPDDPAGIQWALRYGNNLEAVRMAAASYVDTYCYLIGLSNADRNRCVNALKAIVRGEES